MRTRGNGEPLGPEGLAEDIMAAVPGAAGRELAKDAYHVMVMAARREQSAAFDRGFQMAAKLEQGRARAEMARFVLSMLGKDAGDGRIDLGALGQWHVVNDNGDVIEGAAHDLVRRLT